MAERIHRWRVWMTGNIREEPLGSAYDAPPDHDKSTVRLKDLAGVIHSVVKGEHETWLYCDIEVMKDWLVQDGKNVVPDDEPLTCVKCIAGGHEG